MTNHKASGLEFLYFLKLNNIQLMHDSVDIKSTPKAKAIKKLGQIAEPVSLNNYDSSDIRKIVSDIHNLDDFIKAVNNFNDCDLKSGALNTVISDGNPKANIMLIGEAPGAEEDEKAIPFCGQSGALLDNMMKSIGLFRDVNIYITNIVFWRPPENRKPTSKEVEQCRPFLEKHIALIKPKLIIAVGSTAATALIGKNFEITKMRKQYFEYNNIYLDKPVEVTAIFHPAYLIRQSSQKKNAWYDLLAIKEYIEKLGV